jgi:hypothetical protein
MFCGDETGALVGEVGYSNSRFGWAGDVSLTENKISKQEARGKKERKLASASKDAKAMW